MSKTLGFLVAFFQLLEELWVRMYRSWYNPSSIYHMSIYLVSVAQATNTRQQVVAVRLQLPALHRGIQALLSPHSQIPPCKGDKVGLHCHKPSSLTVIFIDRPRPRSIWYTLHYLFYSQLTSYIPFSLLCCFATSPVSEVDQQKQNCWEKWDHCMIQKHTPLDASEIQLRSSRSSVERNH